MRDRRAVFHRLHVETRRLQSRDGAFATRPRTVDANVNVFDAKLERLLGSLLGGTLSCKGCALTASLETAGTSTGPAERIALRIGDRHRCVVEGCFDKSNRNRHVTSLSTFLGFSHSEKTSRGNFEVRMLLGD